MSEQGIITYIQHLCICCKGMWVNCVVEVYTGERSAVLPAREPVSQSATQSASRSVHSSARLAVCGWGFTVVGAGMSVQFTGFSLSLSEWTAITFLLCFRSSDVTASKACLALQQRSGGGKCRVASVSPCLQGCASAKAVKAVWQRPICSPCRAMPWYHRAMRWGLSVDSVTIVAV